MDDPDRIAQLPSLPKNSRRTPCPKIGWIAPSYLIANPIKTRRKIPWSGLATVTPSALMTTRPINSQTVGFPRGCTRRWTNLSKKCCSEVLSRSGGHGFDPHSGSVLKIFPKDSKFWL
ncbi:hypothetical protein DPMN_069789 [Dreissena polymorpha]|uniref:Uncharacterized protein n=1 Tax=Dreissena polymorpha TaxID=45954 RepID=A0A9D4BV76_DREPO|nr:hypothetical protein DPMN_069789 [Dreissena polymorpha]